MKYQSQQPSPLMSGEGDAAQVEEAVEEEYRREEKREQRVMDSIFFCCSLMN
jgi:hypothetical protein